LNHFFQQAETGALSEYAAIEQTISPATLETVAGWLQSTLQSHQIDEKGLLKLN
jgi:hypothetical protein